MTTSAARPGRGSWPPSIERAEIRGTIVSGDPVMRAREFWGLVTADHSAFLDRLPRDFVVRRFPHRLNISAEGSDLRVQFRLDERYSAFVERAVPREVLGVTLPVARVDDLLQGKIWAALEPGRRPSKRRKDLLDIERLIEAYPQLRGRVPPEVLGQIGPDS